MSKLSPRRIDYLIAVFKCSKGKGYARQREIIEELGIAKPTASLMIKKLREEGYLEIRERRIFLDKKGEKMIEEALWKHGVLENAFVKLGLSSREACEISWRILDRVPSKIVERIWRNIGMPDRCPCGYLLPTGDREDILNFEVCKASDSLRRYGSDRSKSD
ncbi:MAG: hypothetical protein DRN59_00310 [Thaumarchaeota archaeon]|nr:MAG: hypothetical protein DRN59_00310 [Nitrososphaerota archaeon]